MDTNMDLDSPTPASREAQLLHQERPISPPTETSLESQQKQLRHKIIQIQQDSSLSASEKARRIQVNFQNPHFFLKCFNTL